MNARRKRTLKLQAVLPFAVLIVATTALADEDVIERCRLETDAAARIACLEAALSGTAGDDDGRAQVPGVPEVPPEPAVDESPVTAASETDAVPAEAPAAPPPAAPRSTQAAGSTIGAEQIKTRADAEAELAYASDLKVARYDHFPHMRLEVYLTNGQVWRQIKGDTQEVRATLRKNQTVDIEESTLGGYKLRLNEMRRTIRVRRVQ